MKMSPQTAAAMLEQYAPGGYLDPGADAADVRSAFAAAIKGNHPDHGGAGRGLALYQEARDVLLKTQETHCAISPCVLCRGVGKTRGRFGAQRCTACGGSGETK